MRPSTDILVFSDSGKTKQIFNSFLAIDQSTVQFAGKDEDGLKKFCGQNFDLVVVEISQPLISELQFIEQLRAFNKIIPLVIVSEYFHDTKGIVFQNQISDFISMPLTLDKLSDTIKSVRKNKDRNEKTKIIKGVSLENTRLSFLYEISKSLSSLSDFDTLLNTLIKITTDALSAERATLFVLDKKTSELWSRVGTGLDRREIRFPKDSGIAGEVVSTGNTIHSEHPYDHPAFNKAIDYQTGFKTRDLICVPLKNVKGDILGAFQILNKIDGGFTSDDVFFFSAIASTAAIALENTLLHEDLKKKYDEIHRLCDELYIAQNQIVIDSKQVALGEVANFITGLRGRYSLSKEIEQLKTMVAKNEDAIEQTDRVLGLHEKYIDKIENYVNNAKRELKTYNND